MERGIGNWERGKEKARLKEEIRMMRKVEEEKVL